MKTDTYKIGDKVRLTKLGKEITFFKDPDGLFIVTRMDIFGDFQITNSKEVTFQFVTPEDVYKEGRK